MATTAPTITRPHLDAVKFTWATLDVYEEAAFTLGSGDIDAADTLTQGGVTATIESITITSGSLAGSDAAGTLKISGRAGGNFGAGAATTTGAGALTLSGIQTTTYDDGSPVHPNFLEHMDRNVQVKGTVGAAFNMVIEGGRDGTNYSTLNDATGTAIAFSAAGIKQVQEVPPYMRPRITAGEVDVTTVSVILVARREPKKRG